MPNPIRPTFRASSEGVNYNAVKFAINRSAQAEKSEYRTVESLKSEQTESSEELHRHRVRVRRRQSPGQGGHSINFSKRGVCYIVATIAMVVFVKFMISQAEHGGVLDEPERNTIETLGN